MKLYLDPPMSGQDNMAKDIEMLKRAREQREALIRIYSWDRPTISLGYFQKPEKILKLEVLEKYGINWVKRPTGGRAVWHHKEITYAVALPVDYPSLPEGVTSAYRFISEPIYKAFIKSGLPVKWARQEQNLTEACFGAPARHEIIYNGHKVVGSAQRRTSEAILQHGSILLAAQPEIFAACLQGINEELLVKQLRYRTITIPIPSTKLKKHLIAEFRRYFV